MKIFWVNAVRMRNIKLTFLLFIVLSICSCATHKTQYGKGSGAVTRTDSILGKKITHRFFLIGDAGYATSPKSQQLLSVINDKLKQSGENTTLLYLGDNIYPHGMPPKGSADREAAQKSLDSQLALAKNFKGRTHFIPGNHDWYSGLTGLLDQEKYIKDYLQVKKSYLPGDGCPIDDFAVNDSITIVAVDSQWYIEDWDNEPAINDNCDIKTREDFFTELESVLNQNQNNTVLLAVHHPLFSNGAHGGQYSLRKQIFPLEQDIPLPIIGSVMNFVRKTSGLNPQDIQARQYRTFCNRVRTLIQNKDNVIVVSGHDHNLQYINKEKIHQIISGSGSKEEGARAVNANDFSYGGTGYAILDVYDNYTSKVTFYSVINGKEAKVCERVIIRPKKTQFIAQKYVENFPSTIRASVYTPEMTQKKGFYKFLFGNYYRSYYSLPIEVKTARLEDLHGGLTPSREGGGHQSMSLRLVDKDGKEYVMRGIKKSATRFLQTVAFKNRYVGNSFKNTYTEEFLMDFYTSAHPYTPLVLDDLSESVGIYHSNPELYYIPKQNALDKFNENYGDQLYIVEERPTDEFKSLKSFGNPNAIESTDDVLINLLKDKKYVIDEKAFIRARLFDMLIGDWDRHTDQWRWARFNTGKDSVVYRPIPRDHDQAFPKYGGALLPIILNVPAIRHMKTYKDDIKNVKWLNREAYPMDLAFITNATEKDWLEQAEYLRTHLTDEAIDKAFAGLPKELQDETMKEIKHNLRKRRDKVAEYALKYRKVLLKTVLLTGTDKKEKFVITRMPGGDTEVKIYSVKKDGETLMHSRVYNRKQTKEIWLYGLDDDDIFEVKGKPHKAILLRLLGGQSHDTYIVENGKKVNIYDFMSKENTYETDRKTALLLTDDYEVNTYDFEKPAYNVFAGYPLLWYNPDDGVKIGGVINYTVNSFNRLPFSQRHSINGNLYFATQGFELGYRGVFFNVAKKWNFTFSALYTSPNFSVNYFGYGNETPNNDNDLGMDYNRVKIQTFSVAPGLFKIMRNGSLIDVQIPFESIGVENTDNRFITEPGVVPAYVFDHRRYAGLTARYRFENYDNASLPALGMSFSALAGWKSSLDEAERNFPFLESSVNFTHRLTADDKLVFSTTFKGKMLFNNDFEFYQAATLGGDSDLRGYRRERFTGRHSFLQSSDVRYTIGRLRNGLLPVKYGLYTGFDYGRVWIDNDDSKKWHAAGGGGLWLNGVEVLTAKMSYFHGSDGGRIVFGLSMGF